jgi:hypothetical protein
MAEAARLRRWLRDGPRLQLVRKLPRVSRGLTAAATGLMLLNALLPTAFTIASGTLIGRVPAAAHPGQLADQLQARAVAQPAPQSSCFRHGTPR